MTKRRSPRPLVNRPKSRIVWEREWLDYVLGIEEYR